MPINDSRISDANWSRVNNVTIKNNDAGLRRGGDADAVRPN